MRRKHNGQEPLAARAAVHVLCVFGGCMVCVHVCGFNQCFRRVCVSVCATEINRMMWRKWLMEV